MKRYFLGVRPKSDPRVTIIPVPLEVTVSYGRGTAKGPDAIIDASYQVEYYDTELGFEPFQIGIELEDAIDCSGPIGHVLCEVEKRVGAVYRIGKLPFVLGGEHSITPAAVRAIAKVNGDFTVLQLDAHADLRAEYDGTPLSHASAIARVRECVPTVQVGIRSLCKEEADLIHRDNLPVFFAHEIYDNVVWMDEAVAAIKTDKVYITVDIDVFDSGVIPHTGTPEPGGLDWYLVTKFLKKVAAVKKIIGMDVVELAPRDDDIASSFTAAKLVYKMIGYYSVQTGICT